jgi:hypothetical protein
MKWQGSARGGTVFVKIGAFTGVMITPVKAFFFV